ncbi:MAG: hypothetical protein IPH53_11855 [Flavobacteriales bacterium]|nr:hypothetical protein [Flavobacteriales bacterium]
MQRPYMDITFNTVQLDLMRSIERAFDALGIVNPDKVFRRERSPHGKKEPGVPPDAG